MPRFDLHFSVNGNTQTITRADALKIRAGSKNYWYAVFTFADNTFSGLDYLSATFGNNPYEQNRGRSKIVPIDAVQAEGETVYQCKIPWEVLTRRATVYVGVFAGDMLVTDEAQVEVTSAAPTMGGESEPSPSWYAHFDEALAAKQDKLIAGEGIEINGNTISAKGGGGSVGDKIVIVEYGDTTQGLYNALIADLGANKVLALHYSSVITTALKTANNALIWSAPWAEGIGVWRYSLSSAGVWSTASEAGVRLEQGTIYGNQYLMVSPLTGMVSPQAPDTIPTENSTKLLTSGGAFAALANKVNTEAGKGLSSNDYTATDKEKVDAIPADPIYLVEITVSTPLSTVKAYLAAGQMPYLRYNNNIAHLRRSNPSADDIRFEFYDEANGKHIVFEWDDSDAEWLATEYPIVKVSGHTSGAILTTDQYGYVQDTPRATFLPKYTTLTLAVSAWEAAASGYTCTKAVTGMTAAAIVLLTFSDTETDFGYSQSANALVFTAPSIPSEAVTVNVAFIEGVSLR